LVLGDGREAIFEGRHHDVLVEEGADAICISPVVLTVKRADPFEIAVDLLLKSVALVESTINPLPMKLRPGATQ
jgi:hypothetical protein